MVIYVGADHRGFPVKGKLIDALKNQGYEIMDCGAQAADPTDDYVDFAASVARAVAKDSQSRGVVVCGSGAGVDIASNKVRGVRSVLGISPDQVYAARHDDDANVLSLAADFIPEEAAIQMVNAFLNTPFERNERHVRRLEKIMNMENV